MVIKVDNIKKLYFLDLNQILLTFKKNVYGVAT